METGLRSYFNNLMPEGVDELRAAARGPALHGILWLGLEFDPFSRGAQLHTAPHTVCALPFLVPVVITSVTSCLFLAIRCCAQFLRHQADRLGPHPQHADEQGLLHTPRRHKEDRHGRQGQPPGLS